jgi:hypothetical protein
MIDEEAAKILKDASCVMVSAELGSINRQARKTIGLDIEQKPFENGLRLLWENEILLRPKVYMGIPGESYEQIISTFDYLGMTGLGQDTELKVLSVLPGSPIKADPQRYGITRYSDKPPYYVNETEWLLEDEILQLVTAFEDSFDRSWSYTIAPSFMQKSNCLFSFIDIRKVDNFNLLINKPEKLASSLTLLMDETHIEPLIRAAPLIIKSNPFNLWQFIIYSEDAALFSFGYFEKLIDAFWNPEHYFEQTRVYSPDFQPEFQTRLFFATSREDLALKVIHNQEDVETIFILNKKLPNFSGDTLPFLAYDPLKLSPVLQYDLFDLYREYPELLLEMPENLF